jgi:hypothetical protein
MIPRALGDLPPAEIGGWDAITAMISAVPYVGGITTLWLSDRRQREYRKRLHHVLEGMGTEIASLKERGIRPMRNSRTPVDGLTSCTTSSLLFRADHPHEFRAVRRGSGWGRPSVGHRVALAFVWVH